MIRVLLALALFAATTPQDVPPSPPSKDPKTPQPVKASDADAIWKKTEEAMKAKSLHFKTSIKVTIKGEDSQLENEVWFKEGNRMKSTIVGNFAGTELNLTLLSDGAKWTMLGAPKAIEAGAAPKTVVDDMRTAIPKGGFFLPGLFTCIARSKGPEVDLGDLFTISELKLGKDVKIGTRAAKVLTFKLSMKDEQDKPDVTLWVDAETYAILKREVNSTATGEHMVETFSEWKTDDLKNDMFALPKE